MPIEEAVIALSDSRERHVYINSEALRLETRLIDGLFAHAASFPDKYTIDQPRFQANIPSCYLHLPNLVKAGYAELAGGFEPIINS